MFAIQKKVPVKIELSDFYLSAQVLSAQLPLHVPNNLSAIIMVSCLLQFPGGLRLCFLFVSFVSLLIKNSSVLFV